MTHSLTRKMSDTFSENDKGFENTTETSHARYQHQRIVSNKPLNVRGFFISVHFNFFSTFLQRLAYLSLLSFSVSFQTPLIHKNT